MSDAGGRRVAVAVPHYWAAQPKTEGARITTAEERGAMLRHVVTSLHETFSGNRRVAPGFDAPMGPQRTVDVFIVTADDGCHLLDHLAPIDGLFTHVPRPVDDTMSLAFECRALLGERAGDYDQLASIEDDIIVEDPFFFDKLEWFRAHAPDDAVLMPNRFERRDGIKAYIDPVLRPEETAMFQDLSQPAEVVAEWPGGPIVFRQVDNPHASCWFVSGAQMEVWARHPDYRVFQVPWVGPLESGMSPAVAGPFRMFKAVDPRPDFLEVEHATTGYLASWALTEMAPGALLRRAHDAESALAAAQTEAYEATKRRAEAEAAYASLLASPTFRLTAPIRSALGRIRRRPPA